MIPLLLAANILANDGGFSKRVDDFAGHFHCSTTLVLRTQEDDHRMALFLCPELRAAIVYDKTPEGNWKPLLPLFVAPRGLPAGETI